MTLTSVFSKVYSYILNRGLNTWAEQEKKIREITNMITKKGTALVISYLVCTLSFRNT